MPRPQGPAQTVDRARIERRRQRRDPAVPVGWETIVLQRMAARVRSLASGPVPGGETHAGSDWERTAVRALQRRVQELEPGPAAPPGKPTN